MVIKISSQDTHADGTLVVSNRLGIGTSSPVYPVHISSTSAIPLYVNSSATNASVLLINSQSSSAEPRIHFSSQGVVKWYVLNLTSSSNKFFILDSTYGNGVYLNQTATSWSSNSDNRLKDIKGSITDALIKVCQLTGVKFTWKQDQGNPDAKVRVGLIAQDVQAVLPEAVDDESPDLVIDEETGRVSGGLGVRYTEVVPLLVNAIKELAMQHQ